MNVGRRRTGLAGLPSTASRGRRGVALNVVVGSLAVLTLADPHVFVLRADDAKTVVRRGRSRTRARLTAATGAWTGEYSYDWAAPPVPFNAILNQRGGILSGAIDEPNTFAPSGVPRLYATLAGDRAGSYVIFRKTYDGTGGVAHWVDYTGHINEAETRIEGRWNAGPASGSFFMTREAPGGDAEEERSAEA